MHIGNCTVLAKHLARKPHKKRQWEEVSHLVIHHYGLALTGQQMIVQFSDVRKYQPGWYTGGKCPYHFFIRGDGTIDQCLPLDYIGPGAINLNTCGIQIALSGDQTKTMPTVPQYTSLVELCIALKDAYHGKLKVVGHTEQPGSSKDPKKSCPGRKLDLPQLRADVDKQVSVAYLKPNFHLEPLGIICDG